MGPLPAAKGCDCHVCRPDEAYDDDLDRGSIETVLQHGWQVILVSDQGGCAHPDHDHSDHSDHDHAPSTPPFAYTVGLGHRCGHPGSSWPGSIPRSCTVRSTPWHSA